MPTWLFIVGYFIWFICTRFLASFLNTKLKWDLEKSSALDMPPVILWLAVPGLLELVSPILVVAGLLACIVVFPLWAGRALANCMEK